MSNLPHKHQHETIQLSNQDWDIFLEALTYPPQLSENLVKAYERYKKSFDH